MHARTHTHEEEKKNNGGSGEYSFHGKKKKSQFRHRVWDYFTMESLQFENNCSSTDPLNQIKCKVCTHLFH